MPRFLSAILALCMAVPVTAGWGADYLERIRQIRLDPEQCYRVRDLFLEREDVKFYFVDGHLIFAEPLDGRTFAALFVASDPSHTGEIILFPPTKRERQSLARFTSQPVLNERFRTAMMFFTDDTAEILRDGLEQNPFNKPDVEEGHEIAPRWNAVMKNLMGSVELSILADIGTQRDPKSGFFGGIISGGTLGRFEVVIDPHKQEQVSIGQVVWRENRGFYEAWCRFRGRNFVLGRRKTVEFPGQLENYRIESRLADDLSMKVVARATLVPRVPEAKLFNAELSRRLSVKNVFLDGEPVEFLEFDRLASAEAPLHRNKIVAIVVDEPLAPGSRHEIEFHYEGKVIAKAGDAVFYVGSRHSWYPLMDSKFTSFELHFHYPEQLDLVATGRLVESRTEEGIRSSLYRTNPIRLAGFNLGFYERESRKVGEYTVEACATKGVEKRLEPPKEPPMVLVDPLPRGRRSPFGRRGSSRASSTIMVEPETPPAPQPTLRLVDVADVSAETVEFFLDRFGPPATSEIVVSPIPGDFGQGFPGLVYAPTLTYLSPDDPPLQEMSEYQKLFYTELLPAHEIAHQWWGNVVAVDSLSDSWLMEALATYSSLLWLEQRRGAAARDDVLAHYRDNLLERNEEGKTIESAGAVVLGERLRSSKFPNARRVIVYEKGAWIIHMLRGVLGDEKFFAFLRHLRDKFERRNLTTEDFRREIIPFVPAGRPDPELENFFDQWVYDTGIPKLTVDYRTRGKAPRLRFTGRLLQTDVPESFAIVVPIEIHTLPGRSVVKYIQTQGALTEFSLVLRNPPSRVVVDPKNFMLTLNDE